MRVLAITNQFPLPLDMGGPIRFLGLTRALAAEHDVRLLALRRPNTTDELVAELRFLLDCPVEVFSPDAPSALGARTRTARWTSAALKGAPPWVLAQVSADLRRRARQVASSVDAVVLLDDYAGTYAGDLSNMAPVIADKSNVMGWALYPPSPARDWRERARRRVGTGLIRRFERACAREADAIVVTSEEESRRFQSLYGRRPDAVIPSAVDPPPGAVELPGGRDIGWLGTHEYEANVEGLMRFVEEAWEPLGRDGCRLLVAGGSPPQSVRALERFPGVQVLGYVERLEDFLGGLSAAVVPLWRGAGVKLKTLTFMGAGLPVAATSVALEGLGAEDGRHCLISDDPAGLASALRVLVTDGERAQALSREGRLLVKERFTWARIGPRFVEVVQQTAAAARRPEPGRTGA